MQNEACMEITDLSHARPLSCKGVNNYGGYALTLIDLLDTLVLFNQTEDFRRGAIIPAVPLSYLPSVTVYWDIRRG